MNRAQPVDPDLVAMLSSCVACQPWAEQDLGPYHRNDQPVRRDIVEDREGVALQLGVRLSADDGRPALDAMVEMWQCDALGRYSGFPPPLGSGDAAIDAEHGAQYLAEDTFLRGGQVTDSAGLVEFRTIYPGWYPGRTVHIHLMVHADREVLTSQLYFPEVVTAEVLARAPYAGRPGRDTTNDADTIFPTGGDPAIVDIAPAGDGYRAAVALSLPTPP